MGYKPIGDYGIIGDMHTAALVGIDGSIDWLCLPDFDSPSVFAAILDDKKGGRFKICSAGKGVSKQFYHPETNVLSTTFSSAEGVTLVCDFMPVGPEEDHSVKRHCTRIIRRVTGIRGTTRLSLECSPAFNYARTSHKVRPVEGGVIFESGSGEHLSLSMPVEYEVTERGVVATFDVSAGQSICFSLGLAGDVGDSDFPMADQRAEQLLNQTLKYWRDWLGCVTYEGRWREMVHRSVLTLKLLTYAPNGAIVAAPTCSLPERIGGSRNWDYRYTWLRDAAFTVYAFMRIGLTQEAEQFVTWLDARAHEFGEKGTPGIMYRLDGSRDIQEEELDHLEGYRGSKPVRVGNGAHHQLQLDIYGELMDAVYLYNKYGSPISYEFWTHLVPLLDWVARNWRLEDEGIWEVRGGRRHFTFSKMMCWVALDRGLRLAYKRSFPGNRDLWLKERDAIYEAIMEQGWHPGRQAFVQYFGSDVLDASMLLMPLVFFISPTDPRMLSTIDAIMSDLTNDTLVNRYDVKQAAADGLGGQEEGSFSACTFWLVEALTRAGRLEEARFIFERMLGYANHLGLYSEMIGLTGEALGNFPQAFTHLALISAAFNLDRKLGKGI
ncbi:MAG: glycoside hydrolase family 15 protein [Chloroflexi bacterium]|nr:glycoside hydrolase family 15 protein [Chloroflexota bacterium]